MNKAITVVILLATMLTLSPFGSAKADGYWEDNPIFQWQSWPPEAGTVTYAKGSFLIWSSPDEETKITVPDRTRIIITPEEDNGVVVLHSQGRVRGYFVTTRCFVFHARQYVYPCQAEISPW